MAQCCSEDITTDEVPSDVLWTDDFEDGVALTDKYVDVIDVTVEATHGFSSHPAAHSAHAGNPGFYAELTKLFADDLDRCGNIRHEFSTGGYWNFANTPPVAGGFYIMEVRSAAGTHPCFSLYREGSDLKLFNANSDVVGRIYNIIPTAGTWTKIEIRGSVSTGFDTEDGWIEIRVNDKIYDKDEDAATRDPELDIIDCYKGWTNIDFDPNGASSELIGWDAVTIGTMGDFKCFRIIESARYCAEPIILKKPGGKCDPPGPGGSSFDGSASGDRVVHPGGYEADYDPPTWGGVPATASDPTDTQTFTGVVTPIFQVKITLPDGSIKRYAKERVNRSGAVSYQNRVLRFGPIPYRLADRFGNIPSQTFEIQLADDDGELRALLASGANRFWTRWQVDVEGGSDAARLAGTAPTQLARGRVIAPPVNEDLTVTLTCSDELTRQFGKTSLDRELPWVRMRDVFKTSLTATGLAYRGGLAEELEDAVLPIIYGEASDDYKSQYEDKTPVGVCKTLYAGRFTLTGNTSWYGFLVSLYAVKDPTGGGLFASNMHPECPGSVRIDPDKYDTDWLVPGKGQWSSFFSTNHIDITTSGTTYRVTMIFGRGPVAKQHVDGKVPVSVNVHGIETTGNSSGTMISDAAYILQHLLDHPILRRTTTGNWGAVGTYSGGTAKVRTTSFLAVKNIHDTRYSNGYRERLIMDKARPARDWLADLQVSADIRLLAANHHGQVCATTLDDQQATTGLTTFTELLHIKEGSFKITPDRNGEVENMQPYEFGPEPATGRFAGSKTHKISQAITDWGEERQADPIVYEGIYDKRIALDVTSRDRKSVV